MKKISKLLIMAMLMNLSLNLDYRFIQVNENAKSQVNQNIMVTSIDPPDEQGEE